MLSLLDFLFLKVKYDFISVSLFLDLSRFQDHDDIRACTDEFFFSLIDLLTNCGVRIFVTQRGSAGLATCLAHWISLDENVLHLAMYLYLHFSIYRSFRYWTSKKFLLIAQKKKEKKHCRRGSSRSRSIFLPLSETGAQG